MWESLSAVLERFQLLICPTLAVPGVALNHSPIDPDFQINGRPVAADFGWMLTYPFNMLSPLPVMSIPSGFTPCGVPTGMQITGRPYDDLSVFRGASTYERASAWPATAGYRPQV